MSTHYCHDCAIRIGHIAPIDASVPSLTGSQYQLKKFIKHTAPEKYDGLISIFFSDEYAKYRDFSISGSLSGNLEIDTLGRRNLVWYAGRDIGFTYQDGIYQVPNDAVKVVLPEDAGKIHAYPVNYELQYFEKCRECERTLLL
jgi:hypothetical protein